MILRVGYLFNSVRESRETYCFAKFEVALDVDHIVPADGGGVALTGELEVEDFLCAGAEHHFGTDERELPHAAEALVVHGLDFGAMCLKAGVPVLKCRLA